MYQLLQASKWSGNECCPPLEAMKAPVDGGQGLEIFLEFEARKIPPEIKRGKVFLNNFLMIPIHSVYIFISS